MDLPSGARKRYTEIIDSILASSDINTISEKRIRRGLQDAVGQDLMAQKPVIKELIMQRFDIFAAENEKDEPTINGDGPTSNGYHTQPTSSESPGRSSSSPQKRSADDGDRSPDDTATKPPPTKKRKEVTVDSDAAFAAKLQAEENLRARTTRGGANPKKTPAKNKKKKQPKGPKKVSDDSDVEASGSDPKKEVNRSGGFHKPLNLSPPLSSLLGEVSLSRPQTVKKLWAYIHENGLQDPADRRHIVCDDPMRAVFKQDRIHMFTMTKILSQNLYNPDE